MKHSKLFRKVGFGLLLAASYSTVTADDFLSCPLISANTTIVQGAMVQSDQSGPVWTLNLIAGQSLMDPTYTIPTNTEFTVVEPGPITRVIHDNKGNAELVCRHQQLKVTDSKGNSVVLLGGYGVVRYGATCTEAPSSDRGFSCGKK